MESYPLYGLAAKYGIKAATVLTVSDIIFKSVRGEKDKMRASVDKMVTLILDAVADNYDYLTGK